MTEQALEGTVSRPTEENPRPAGPSEPTGPLSLVQLKTLRANLNPNRIASLQKPGQSKPLAYLKQQDVRATLIKVFGFGGWSLTQNSEPQIIRIEENVKKASGNGTTNWRVTVMASMKLYIDQLDATYSATASSTQAGSVLGDVLDFALKTAESDAMKRCAINLGTQFGLSLYFDGRTADVVTIVLAPGQEWPRPDAAAQNPEAQAQIERAFSAPEPVNSRYGSADDEVPATVEDPYASA